MSLIKLPAPARLAPLVACLALAACGDSQNWDNERAFVSVGGNVSGLTGTVGLRNNGQDDLALTANGSFTFPLQIATGDSYSVTISRQPVGQVCTIANGSGTATARVTNVAVTCRSNVTVGGTISGLTGTIVLQNNGTNALATAANGPFTFTASIPNGAAYAVTIRTQPVGQVCTVANGSGTATANVTNVAVACETFTLRPLPAIYGTGKAINYSPYRAGGPGAGERPTDAEILEDLALLRIAGYDLLRLFGGDAVSESILRLARDNFPEMKFQQGIFLQAVSPSCVDEINDSQIATGIRLANTYPNVVTVSVGNETSFFSRFMPLACLEGYVTKVRSSVRQPVTADDDYTFYAGLTSPAFGPDRVTVKPDTILALIDFVSIHMYPISNYGQWDWRQTATPAGPARAAAMMNAALANAKSAYAAVAAYEYTDLTGAKVSVGASRPIVVGETGWKAMQTNPGSPIEAVAATPVNAKWYFDLLYGNPATSQPSWERSAGGPVSIFYFEMTDEAWKQEFLDDGWGLWDKDRIARYALCGTPAGPACNADLYAGAGYFGATPPGGSDCTAPNCVDFSAPGIGFAPFENAGGGTVEIAADPTAATNQVVKFVKKPGDGEYFGTVITGLGGSVVLTPAAKTVTMRVWSPAAGTNFLLKFEGGTGGPASTEKDAVTTMAGQWETLSFEMPDAGTYSTVVVFPNGRSQVAADKTMYMDDLKFPAFVPSGGLVGGVFADDYTGDLPATARSTQGGDVGFFFDPRLAKGVGATYDYAGVAGSAVNPGGVPNFYYGLGLNPPAITNAYFGAFVKAPGNGTVDLSDYTNVVVNVWGPDQLFRAGTFPTLEVVMQGPAVAGCASPSGGSEVAATFATTGQGAAQNYTVPLAGFALAFACSGETTVAEVLARITQVNIVLKNANIQYVNRDPDGVAYTNGLNVGSIKFN